MGTVASQALDDYPNKEQGLLTCTTAVMLSERLAETLEAPATGTHSAHTQALSFSSPKRVCRDGGKTFDLPLEELWKSAVLCLCQQH